MQEQRERELKFDAPDGWAVPNLGPLVPSGGSVEVETLQLAATYYDTPGCDLLGHGLTLRRRTGGADAGWHLKIPDGDARTELRLPLSAGTSVPAELRELVVAARAGSPLRRKATVETTRTVHRVHTAAAAVLEIADDLVRATAFGDAPVLSEWHEVEIELIDGTEKDLDSAAELLKASGVTPAAISSKLSHALNYTKSGPPQPHPDSLHALVQHYLMEQHRALMAGDIALRRGRDNVHPIRVASRRMRSALRAFHGLLDADRATALEAELRWYASLLGEVRDRQVLRTELAERAAAGRAPRATDAAAERLAVVLDEEQQEALGVLRRTIDGRRYLAMIREIRAWAQQPPLLDVNIAATAAADHVVSADARLRKRLRQWSRRPHEDVWMHDARKAAKRVRYAAELAGPTLADGGRKITKRAQLVQQRLGVVQDVVAAAEFMRHAASGADAQSSFELGVLWSAEQQRLRRLRRKALRELT